MVEELLWDSNQLVDEIITTHLLRWLSLGEELGCGFQGLAIHHGCRLISTILLGVVLQHLDQHEPMAFWDLGHGTYFRTAPLVS